MIRLTRLNGTDIIVNNDLVKTIEATPDTTLTLINGEKLMVKEPIDTVLERIVTFRRQLLPVTERAMEL
jgi:flagellar protein FlbD